MAFGSPESAGIPRLAHIVFTVKGNPQQNSHKKSEFHPSSRSRTTAAFVPRCLHSPYIFYGNSTEPDPQLYHVILSCKSAIRLSKPRTLRHEARDEIFQAPSPFFGGGAWVRGYCNAIERAFQRWLCVEQSCELCTDIRGEVGLAMCTSSRE